MIPRKPRTKAKLKERIVCKKCFIAFKNTSLKGYAICPKCGRHIEARIRTEQSKIYALKHPERIEKCKKYDIEHKRERSKANRELLRKVNFNIISGGEPKCVNCGCDDQRLLEINHINGGGNKELKNGKNTNAFAWNIYMGRRNTSDLNLLCRVCNALHYLEGKYGKTGHIVTFRNRS